MTTKKVEWAMVPKVLLDATMLLVFGIPAFIASYIWQAMSAGWAFGEWAFDPDSFHRRYGDGDTIKEILQQLRDVVKL